MTLKNIARSLRLNDNTLSDWQYEHPEFKERLLQARADRIREVLGMIVAASRDKSVDWRALAWWMERVDPEGFGTARAGTAAINPAMVSGPTLDAAALAELAKEAGAFTGGRN